jgi:serine/threonine protein kinase
MDSVGRYQIVRELGRGGMGVVYLGHDPAIERPVAIKTLRASPELPAEAREQCRRRFMREAKAAGRLNHAHIVSVYDVGTDGPTGSAFIAMEYLPGATLQVLLEQEPRLSPDRALEITRQLAEALAYAHSKGVIHRDIKAANVMFDQAGRAKLADFGIARLDDSRLTRTGQVLGSPQTMAPEQVEGGEVDARTDLFSLGVLLYRMLTGEPPFRANDLNTLFYQILHVDPVPATTLNQELPPDLDPVVRTLLAKSPDDRYQDASQLLQDLRRLSAGTSPGKAAGPPRLRSSPGRRVGHAVLLLLLLVALSGYGMVRWLGGPSDASPAARTPAASTAGGDPDASDRPQAEVAATPRGAAVVMVDFEHHIEDGSYQILLDGEPIHQGRLRARKQARRFVPGIKLAHESIRETLTVPAGGLVLEVRVTSPSRNLNTARSIEAVLADGERRSLEIRVQRITNKLSLKWK